MVLLRTVLLLLLCHASSANNAYPEKVTFNVREFLRLRCSLNPSEQVIMTWKGSAYLHVYQMPPRNVFDVIGMNVARCLINPTKNLVILTSREAQLYLDPTTGAKLNKWTNPYTGMTVPVMHVANDPVQNIFPRDGFSIDGYITNENQVVVPMDVNLFYPNPLYNDSTLRTYSKEQFYEAGEFFKFFTRLDEINNERLNQVNQSDLSWTRVSPVLPWMNMSSTFNATMITSAQGTKIDDITQIDKVLLNEIVNRIPIYKNAPECQLDTPSETSWTYFKKNFAAYLSGSQEFPIPKSTEDIPCVPS